MSKILQLAVVVYALNFSASALAQECGSDLNNKQSQLGLVVKNVRGISYIRDSIDSLMQRADDMELCASGIQVGKEDWQFVIYFLQIDIHSKSGKTPDYRMAFYFPNGSAQVYENLGKQPWFALPTKKVDEVLLQYVENKSGWVAAPGVSAQDLDPVALVKAMPLYQVSRPDAKSISAISMPIRASNKNLKRAYLVTWLSEQNNIFADPARMTGVLVGEDQSGRVVVDLSESSWLGPNLIKNLVATKAQRAENLTEVLLGYASETASALQ